MIMAKTFKEACEEFQEVMKKFNNILIGIDGQILPDVDAEKHKELERKEELKELEKNYNH